LKHDASKTGDKENMGRQRSENGKMREIIELNKIKERLLCREACRDPDHSTDVEVTKSQSV